MEQAQEVQANLESKYPSFTKLMLRSDVSGGFLLGLPMQFCLEHMPKEDKTMVLVDEDEQAYDTKYLTVKNGLSGGWRGFSLAHELVEGDALVFQLIEPCKFKVYIIRASKLTEVDGAISLLNLDCLPKPFDEEFLLYDISPFVRVYGRAERLIGTDSVPPSNDLTTGAQSKNIVISHNVSARIYLPKLPNKFHKIPLLVYFHGGAFFTGSPFNQVYHNHLNSLVSKANVVAVSVNYRLAPEHPLPIGYEDSWAALKWVISQSKGNATEMWLKQCADFGHVYLGGDSAGGNIAHNMAMRVGLDNTDQSIVLDGMFLNSPYFWGKKPIGDEDNPKFSDSKRVMESIWIHAYPNKGFDDPLVNPAKDPNISSLGCKRVLIIEGGEDILKDRGFYYEKALTKSKWNGVVKVVEVEGEGHDFGIGDSQNAKKMVNLIASFLNHQGEM